MGLIMNFGPIPPLPSVRVKVGDGNALVLSGVLEGTVVNTGGVKVEDELIFLPKKAFLDLLRGITVQPDMEDDEEEDSEKVYQDPKGPLRVSQLDLVAAITKELDRQGIRDANPRQYNSIIDGANTIVDEFRRPHRPVTPNSGVIRWLETDEVGASSRFMAYTLAKAAGNQPSQVEGLPWNLIPIPPTSPILDSSKTPHPQDPSDLGRCLGLLSACPDLRPFISQMAECSFEWAVLVAGWHDLERLYQEELAAGGPMTKTYHKMQMLFTNPLSVELSKLSTE